MVDFSTNKTLLYWKTRLTTQYADVLLLVCCFSSGLLDSSVFAVYGTFVSMQTGNTIFIALGASNQDAQPYAWARSLTSVCCFALGALFFARTSKIFGPRARLSLAASFSIQATCLLVTAALLQAGIISQAAPTHGMPIHWDNELPIILLSFQSAGQIVASRALGFNEVPTVVITSLLCDLMSDQALFIPKHNAKRDRRILAFVLTLIGGISGGWITKAGGNLSLSLWVAAGLKYGIMCSWIFWKGEITSAA